MDEIQQQPILTVPCPLCGQMRCADLVYHLWTDHNVKVWIPPPLPTMTDSGTEPLVWCTYQCICRSFQTGNIDAMYDHLRERGKECALIYYLAQERPA